MANPAASRVKELNQEARDRKRQKKHRGHAAGSRANGGDAASAGKKQRQAQDPRVGSKKPIPLGVSESSAPAPKQHKPKSEKPMLSPQAELELLENDERPGRAARNVWKRAAP